VRPSRCSPTADLKDYLPAMAVTAAPAALVVLAVIGLRRR
jgi:hypothetical protein